MSIAAVVITGVLVVFLFDPMTSSIYPRCMFHSLTGLDCPFCGSTRALHQLLHGNLAAAFRFNPLAISLLPLVGYLAARRELVAMRPVWMWTLLGMVVVFGVVRNIPAWPFTVLAP